MKSCKKFVILLLCAALLLSMQSVSFAESDQLTGKLRIAVWSIPDVDTIDPVTNTTRRGVINLINQWAAENPGVSIVNIQAIPQDGWQQKVQTLLLSGEVDVLYASIYDNYAQGLVYNLKDLIARDCPDLWERYVDGTKYTERVSFNDDHIIGLPADLSANTLAYDKTILEQWGVEPLSDNPTPEEIYEVISKCTGINPVTGKQNYGLYIDVAGYQSNYSLDELNGGFSIGDFNRLDYSQSTIAIDTPENVAKVENWIRFLKYLHPGATTGTGIEKWGTEENDIAVYMRATSVKSEVLKQTQLYDRFIYTSGVYAEDNTCAYNAPMTWCIASSIADENLEAAWSLIQYLSGYEGQKFFFEEYGALPSLKNADFVDNSEDPFAQHVLSKMLAAVSKPARNQFFPPVLLKSFRPWLNEVVARTLDGEVIDVAEEMAACQQAGEVWRTEQLPLDFFLE